MITRLGDLNPQVVTDPGGQRWNAWRSFRACLESCPPDASHLLTLQDDAEPCPGFDRAARTVLTIRPDVIVCFYVGGGRVGLPLERAASICSSWAPLARNLWVPLVATAFPQPIVQELLAWADNDPWVTRAFGDDAVLGKFMRERHHTAWATVPNLVQHPDVVPSVTKRRAAMGRDRSRVAACWIGDFPASEIEW